MRMRCPIVWVSFMHVDATNLEGILVQQVKVTTLMINLTYI